MLPNFLFASRKPEDAELPIGIHEAILGTSPAGDPPVGDNPNPPVPPRSDVDPFFLRCEALNAAKHCTSDPTKLLRIAEDIHNWLIGKPVDASARKG